MASDVSATATPANVDYWASEADLRRQVFEGQLNKFTNVVKGWQFRWFVLRPETGHLDYHLMEDTNPGSTVLLGKEPNFKIGKCRGSQHLAGCMVVPSDEDSLTFNAIFASGETYKLRASNVRERQVWVDRLRAVAHLHDKAIAQTHPPLKMAPSHPVSAGGKSQLSAKGEPSEALQHLSLSVLDAFGSVHDILQQADMKHRSLAKAIGSLPLSGSGETPLCNDPDLLMIKATSQSALLCMENALAILQDLVEQRQVEQKVKQTPTTMSPKKTPSQDSQQPIPEEPQTTSSIGQPRPLSSTVGLAPHGLLSTSQALSRSTPAVNQQKMDDLGSDSISTASAEEHFHDSRGGDGS